MRDTGNSRPIEDFGLDTLHRDLLQRLSPEFRRRLRLLYEPAQGGRPAAIIIHYSGRAFRLEHDISDGKWTVATDEDAPRLLDRISDEGFEAALRLAFERY